MKENYINWIGNRVLDPSMQNQKTPAKEPSRIYSPTQPKSQQKADSNNPQAGRAPISHMPSHMQTEQSQDIPRQTQSPMTQLGDTPATGFETPPTLVDKNYIPGYLTNLIGRRIRAEFVLGTNLFLDKTGVLREVGVNYFVLEDLITGSLIICDLYSVKFVTTV